MIILFVGSDYEEFAENQSGIFFMHQREGGELFLILPPELSDQTKNNTDC